MKHIKSFEGANSGTILATSDTLFKSIKHNNVTKVKQLIENGIDVNILDYRGYTPLLVAANFGNLAIIMALIDAGADWDPDTAVKNDFLGYLGKHKKEQIIAEYPEKYEHYLLNKTAKKYNM